eukprot:TRINITY_DN7603_c0_g2_i3.p1 TRINITY_DN7603_c0_g2~~TRINITY_DN7603_c0_g2_i3.p1  ORF type:complete len:219 (+),score=3.71 TRINITY_DN7603_c0_g2_i3:84-740(+)
MYIDQLPSRYPTIGGWLKIAIQMMLRGIHINEIARSYDGNLLREDFSNSLHFVMPRQSDPIIPPENIIEADPSWFKQCFPCIFGQPDPRPWLELRNLDFNQNTFNTVVADLKRNNTRKNINFSWSGNDNVDPNVGFIKISKALATAPYKSQLSLDFSNTSLRNEGCAAVKNVLFRSTTLESLSLKLANPGIDNHNFDHISESLANLQNLSQLCIHLDR